LHRRHLAASAFAAAVSFPAAPVSAATGWDTVRPLHPVCSDVLVWLQELHRHGTIVLSVPSGCLYGRRISTILFSATDAD
jgi:hypothetical protein